MTNYEKLIAQIMKECEEDGNPVTREEAEEMAKMELGSKEVNRYTKSDELKKKVKKERKVDETKKIILEKCLAVLAEMGAKTTTTKTETEITFTYENEEYSLKLIKHRPKKE